MKKLIILLMAGLMIMPACQNSSKENIDQMALQIKLLSQSLKENVDRTALQTELLSQSVSKLSSSVYSLQQGQGQNASDSKKLPSLSICPKDFPLSAVVPFECVWFLFKVPFFYTVGLFYSCKNRFMKWIKK